MVVLITLHTLFYNIISFDQSSVKTRKFEINNYTLSDIIMVFIKMSNKRTLIFSVFFVQSITFYDPWLARGLKGVDDRMVIISPKDILFFCLLFFTFVSFIRKLGKVFGNVAEKYNVAYPDEAFVSASNGLLMYLTISGRHRSPFHGHFSSTPKFVGRKDTRSSDIPRKE